MPVKSRTRSKSGMLLIDLAIASLIILLFSLFRAHADWVLLISWPLIFGYILLTRRIKTLVHLFLATIMAVIWVQFAKEYYGYKFDYLRIFGMNTLPLMAWTLTLLGLGEMCNYLQFKRRIFRYLIFVPSFWVLLILFETVAYHVLEIRNTMTGNYAGLPFCNCLHAPTWMKFVYFSMGPLFYGLSQSADYLLEWKFPALFRSNYLGENQFKSGLFAWN